MNNNAKDFITLKLLEDNLKGLSFADVIRLMQTAGPSFEPQFTAALKSGRIQALGALIDKLVRDDSNAKAESRADEILADNALSSAEINEIFK